MGAVILPGATTRVEPGPGTLEPDLVHDTLVRTPGGAVFATGWADDTPAPPPPGAERQKESA